MGEGACTPTLRYKDDKESDPELPCCGISEARCKAKCIGEPSCIGFDTDNDACYLRQYKSGMPINGAAGLLGGKPGKCYRRIGKEARLSSLRSVQRSALPCSATGRPRVTLYRRGESTSRIKSSP